MGQNKAIAQPHYEAAIDMLLKYCDKETDLTAEILADTYPFRVRFIPSYQMEIFDNENVDKETGEISDMTVTVGLNTTVKSSLKFRMDSKQLKKLIKLAETVGQLYYQAFREEAGDLGEDEELKEMLRSAIGEEEEAAT